MKSYFSNKVATTSVMNFKGKRNTSLDMGARIQSVHMVLHLVRKRNSYIRPIPNVMGILLGVVIGRR